MLVGFSANTFPLLGIRTNTPHLLEFRTNTRIYSALFFGHSSQAQTGHFLQSIISKVPSKSHFLQSERLSTFSARLSTFSTLFSTNQHHPTNRVNSILPVKSTASDQSSQHRPANKHKILFIRFLYGGIVRCPIFVHSLLMI